MVNRCVALVAKYRFEQKSCHLRILYETQIFDSMSNIKFLFFLSLIIYENVAVNRGVNC